MTFRHAAGTATTIIASLCLAAGDSLAAQDVGDRVRVTIVGDVLTGDGIVCTETTFLWFSEESCEIQGTAFWWGILGGTAVGFVVGKAAFRENWEAIPITDRSGPTLSPLVDFGSGVHSNATMILGARIRF